MKQICSEKEDLRHRLGDLESWLVNRGYRADSIRREMQKCKLYLPTSVTPTMSQNLRS